MDRKIETWLRNRYKPFIGVPQPIKDMPHRSVGWGSTDPVFKDLIENKVRPARIIEVGSWLGESAIHMANICKGLGLNFSILCVDTWLGDYWAAVSDLPQDDLQGRWGFPGVFDQFCSNIIRAGHQDVVIPFPQTSENAARIFNKFGVTADLVYIDAAHERHEVIADLRSYYPLADKVLFGHDLHIQGVREALGEFGIPYQINGDHWWMEK